MDELELAQRVAAARRGLSDLDQRYDEAWLERQTKTFRGRYVRRVRSRRLAKFAGVAALALAFGTAVHRDHPVSTPHELAHREPPTAAPLAIEDGSIVTAFDRATVYRLKEASPLRAVVELVSGGARFQVAHRPARSFLVEAGPAVVEVLGTEFSVERMAERVRVSVLSGQVQVTVDGRTRQLVEGETGVFPRPTPAEGASDQEPALSPSSGGPLKRDDLHDVQRGQDPRIVGDGRVKSSPGKWRSLASRGKLGDAYQELEREGWSIPGDATSLLLAADVARRTHHPAQAVAPLRRMLQAYPQDARASAAAFTLGRVLMDTGAYREAAASYANAWSLDGAGVIAEDAAAREVEAWSRAGEMGRASERATAYAARYPQGRRLDAVRRYGGLE